jgi:hypothetical protein
MNKWKLYSKESEEGSYNSNFITKLRRNFRSHELILELPNRLFYDGELIVSMPHTHTHTHTHTLCLCFLPLCKCPINFASGRLHGM